MQFILSDLKLFEPITICPLVTLRDRGYHQPEPADRLFAAYQLEEQLADDEGEELVRQVEGDLQTCLAKLVADEPADNGRRSVTSSQGWLGRSAPAWPRDEASDG